MYVVPIMWIRLSMDTKEKKNVIKVQRVLQYIILHILSVINAWNYFHDSVENSDKNMLSKCTKFTYQIQNWETCRKGISVNWKKYNANKIEKKRKKIRITC